MTNDEEKPRRLYELAEHLAAKISDTPRGHDVSSELRIPQGRAGGGQWTRDGSSAEPGRSRRQSARLANTRTPAPFLDDYGNPVLNSHGEPMQRPADVDMSFFVDKGIETAEYVPPDTPQIGGLELYGAAAGIPSIVVLEAADHYAEENSHYGAMTMDATYKHLSKQDADDIRLGYNLYQSGRIGPSGAR